jgi:hypothetical protein
MSKSKSIRALLGAALFLFACSSKPRVEKPEPDPPVASDPLHVACSQEHELQCADGLVDGCAGEHTSVHVCIAADDQTAPPCEQEIARECPDGLTDACLIDPPVASTHLCADLAPAEAETTPSDAEPESTPEPEPAS